MNNTESDALLYKAVNPDLTSRGGLRWEIGSTVTHPASTEMVRDDPSTYLSLSAGPAKTLIGRGWPARLLRVEPLSEVITSRRYRHKRCALSVRVVDEVDSWRVFGPQGEAVVALIDRAGRITADEARQLDAARAAARAAAAAAAAAAAWAAAWDAAWVAAWDAARDVAMNAAGDAAWGAAGAAARDAAAALVVRDVLSDGHFAAALVVRDVLSDGHFAALTGPWVSVMGSL
jgi:hypothetical protein